MRKHGRREWLNVAECNRLPSHVVPRDGSGFYARADGEVSHYHSPVIHAVTKQAAAKMARPCAAIIQSAGVAYPEITSNICVSCNTSGCSVVLSMWR